MKAIYTRNIEHRMVNIEYRNECYRYSIFTIQDVLFYITLSEQQASFSGYSPEVTLFSCVINNVGGFNFFSQ